MKQFYRIFPWTYYELRKSIQQYIKNSKYKKRSTYTITIEYDFLIHLQAGMYWLQLMDKYAANWSVLLIAICECILVAWIYGADRFLNDVQLMIGPRSRLWRFFWTWMWKVITPATLFFILFFNWVEYEPLTYGDYVYPRWADVVGWVVGIIPVLVIFGLAIVRILIILYSIEISKWIYWIVSWHFVLYRLFNNRRTNTICGKVFLWFILQ